MLDVQYMYDKALTFDHPVAVRETRGTLRFKLYRGLFLPEGVAALNSAVQELLAGGQWFQLWRGEIVSMRSPLLKEPYGRIHRGSLVDQEAGSRDW